MIMKTTVQKIDAHWDPAKVFALLYERHAVLSFLDSSMQNEIGKHSVIGINPYCTVEVKEDRILLDHKEINGSFEEVMKQILHDNYEKNTTSLPLISGCIGYMSYDYGMRYNGVAGEKGSKYEIPDCLFLFYDNYIIFDHENQNTYLTASGQRDGKGETVEQLYHGISKMLLEQEDKKAMGEDESLERQVQVGFSAGEYGKCLDRIRSHIEEGDIYVINMTQHIEIKTEKTPLLVYQKLRQKSPSPYAAYIKYRDFDILCSSPEQFLKVRNGVVTTRPIKGTRKRGDNLEQDRALRQELVDSKKDMSELVMVTDLERNDLNRVCKVGTVKVNRMFEVETYATVFHLVSEVEGELEETIDLMDVLQHTFPGGSITGAPKIRAMEIIEHMEKHSRGIYTGTLGYLSFDRCCDMNIIIRTAVAKDGSYHLGVGGGITYESENEFEYEETLQKARAILEATE